MIHPLKIALLVSALAVVNTFPAAPRRADTRTRAGSSPPARVAFASRAEPASEGVMRNVSGDYAHAKKRRVPLGAWGGEHVRMEVSEDSATIEFDCAHATIPRLIPVDRRGRFDVAGTYAEEHGGPVRMGDQTGGDAARFTGRVAGETMKLTVSRGDTREAIETFTLAHGREASLVKCR